MAELDDKKIAEYFRRSYTAVDGLWFLKAEERYGFDAALELDQAVWEILPKIQARMLKSMLGKDQGLEALQECLAAKLRLEGFQYELERTEDGFRLVIRRCPWHDLMVKSGREALSGRVGDSICPTELKVWTSEFGDDIEHRFGDMICQGSPSCEIEFVKKNN
jgi:hypothetical protein